jgi:hypothetical protein
MTCGGSHLGFRIGIWSNVKLSRHFEFHIGTKNIKFRVIVPRYKNQPSLWCGILYFISKIKIYAESRENLQNWKYSIFQVFWRQISLVFASIKCILTSLNSISIWYQMKADSITFQLNTRYIHFVAIKFCQTWKTYPPNQPSLWCGILYFISKIKIYAESCENLQNWKYPIFLKFCQMWKTYPSSFLKWKEKTFSP